MDEALKKLYNWAYANMEGCDEPEFTLFDSICGAIEKYHSDKMLLEFLRNNDIPDYDENIEF